MINALIGRKLVKAIIAVIILVYFMARTTGPKIIFAPFLFCAFASIGKNIGLLFNKRRLALFFDRVFKVSFFMFWFGFLAVACYFMIRDGNYRMLPFTVPFWLAGIFFAKRKFRNWTDKENTVSQTQYHPNKPDSENKDNGSI